ncbi:glycosyltransferase family 2 protein [Vibrio nitrifigilis]|uniref:Glycosyltransferase family 2 protein n=1 Tax=Vibrio nitrifigilis TaxID=2789781 RepID=A0ABS0GGV0_9VIBR|nr:glycosyltransferase family 2 protein [Vibrio nitrifigilis]MBF9001661.1 glycosyltransferase family 2 protein [Vibrio nitrifigilis]
MLKLSVVLPAKNEQGNIGRLIEEIHTALVNHHSFEVVLTDDGSTDNTAQEAIETAARLNCALTLLHHPKSCGQSTAVHSAVRHAKGEWIATLDADGQNDPADLLAMLDKASSLHSEHFCIAGYRNKRKDTAWVHFQSRVANAVRQFFLRDGVPDSGCGLKVFPRNTFLLLPYFDHMHRFLPALIRRMNGEIIVHPVNHRERTVGESKYNVWNRLWVGIADMIGVMWLRKRTKWPTIEVKHSSHSEQQNEDI